MERRKLPVITPDRNGPSSMWPMVPSCCTAVSEGSSSTLEPPEGLPSQLSLPEELVLFNCHALQLHKAWSNIPPKPKKVAVVARSEIGIVARTRVTNDDLVNSRSCAMSLLVRAPSSFQMRIDFATARRHFLSALEWSFPPSPSEGATMITLHEARRP